MNLTHDEMQLIVQLRKANPAENIPSYAEATHSQHVADKVTKVIGSWKFLIIQSCILACWLVLNIVAWVNHWDPYPFILLNLALSFQAAYTAPVILMSQNREAQIDRQKLEYYYNVNVKEELEIELLHHKVDAIIRKLDIPREEYLPHNHTL